MRKSVYLNLAVIVGIMCLLGVRVWRQRQEVTDVRIRADAQWAQVMELYSIVHATGVETIEAQIARTDLTSEYRKFLADNLSSWQVYLEACAPDVDMLAAELIVNATTMDEVLRRDRRLADLVPRVMMPWIRMAHYFPNEKVARP